MFARVHTPRTARLSRLRTRIDPIAAAWGGLVGAIGLMAGAGRDWPARLVIGALAFGLAGFLAGVRSIGRRPAHAVAAWLAAHLIHAAFIALANLVDLLGGPSAPPLLAGGLARWAIAAVWTLACALIGALLAHRWLTPPLRHH